MIGEIYCSPVKLHYSAKISDTKLNLKAII